MNSTVTTLGANYLVHTGYFNTIYRLKVCTIASYRYYSTSKSDSQSSDLPPVPILTINNLDNKDCIKSSLSAQAYGLDLVLGRRVEYY